MSDLFSPFIKPSDGWKLHKHFGQADETQPGSLILASHVRTDNPDNRQLYAAVKGKLTFFPPQSFLPTSGLSNQANPVMEVEDELTLYLVPGFSKQRPDYAESVDWLESTQAYHKAHNARPKLQSNYLRYFVYAHIDTATVQAVLGNKWDSLLQVGTEVEAGQPIGSASQLTENLSPVWTAGFAVVTKQGVIDPGTFYDKVRSYVDPTEDIDALIQLLTKHWPLIAPDIDPETVSRTTTLYPYSALIEYKNQVHNGSGLSYAQWRAIGDRQKALYRQRLIRRTRPDRLTGQTIPEFAYNMDDLFNLFQLEAVTEFYMNFDNPWDINTDPQPIDVPSDQVNLLPLEGIAATVNGKQIVLDGDLDVTRFSPGLDVLMLNYNQYRILSLDKAQNPTTVIVDDTPQVNGPTPWSVRHAPSLVLIDSLGYRVTGLKALPVATSSFLVQLDDLNAAQVRELTKLNPHADTISFNLPEADWRHFRIEVVQPLVIQVILVDEVDNVPSNGVKWHIKKSPKPTKHSSLYGSKALPGQTAKSLILDDVKGEHLDDLAMVMERIEKGQIVKILLTLAGKKRYFTIDKVAVQVVLGLDSALTSFPSTGVAWQIPAGVGGTAGRIKRPTRKTANGWDHYDGAMFVVLDGQIEAVIPWTSYSSRVNKKGRSMSTLRGNRYYYITSYLSPRHSFTFRVIDEQALLSGYQATKQNPTSSTASKYKLDDSLLAPTLLKESQQIWYWNKKKKKFMSTKKLRPLDFFMVADTTDFFRPRKIKSLDEANGEIILTTHVDGLDNTAWRIRLYDGVHEAYYYFENPMQADVCDKEEVPPHYATHSGKGTIRLHTGYREGPKGNGSEGCLVSPYYYYLRNLLVEYHLSRYDFYYVGSTNRSNIENIRSTQKTSAPAEKLIRISRRIEESNKTEAPLIKQVTERVNQLLEDTTLSEAELEPFEELRLIMDQLESVLIEPEDAGDEPDPTEYLLLADALIEIMASPIVSEKLIGDTQDVIGAAIVEWKRRLEQLEKQLKAEKERLSWWNNIIIGDLWLIRPDERPTPTS